MHNDYYFTDIKGTPFRWSQTSPWRRESWFCLSHKLTASSCPLLVLVASGLLSPEDTESTFFEETSPSMPVWNSYCSKHSWNLMLHWVFLGGGEGRGVVQPPQAGIAEALLTCVFQGSVIWNSQMSPWQMNGKVRVMEAAIHALSRLFPRARREC